MTAPTPPAAPDILTFGCRLNAFESDVMHAHARAAGLDDTVVVNTCAVTAEAVRQAQQSIRKLRRERPDARIVVTGCAAQVEPARFAAMTEVDHVLGNAEKRDADRWRALGDGTTQSRIQVGDIMAPLQTARPPLPHHPIDGVAGRARAHLEIQNGCDHRCTFCIIPYGRGPSRSVPLPDVVAQVRRLVEQGHVEIVLTGVDITAWGLDLGGEARLGDLVLAILRETPELPRLRLSSINSVEVDDRLRRAIAEEARLMPHLHLSLQAGDDLVLKRMKRRHSRADSVAFCREVRRLRPDVVLGADLIAGFPTETEAMFANTAALIEDCGLTWLHVFPYSARPGTPAARMPAVDGAAIKERARRLRQLGEVALGSFLDAEIGCEREVLLERPDLGRTAHYAAVALQPAGDATPFASAPHLRRVRIEARDGDRLRGTLLPDAGAAP